MCMYVPVYISNGLSYTNNVRSIYIVSVYKLNPLVYYLFGT